MYLFTLHPSQCPLPALLPVLPSQISPPPPPVPYLLLIEGEASLRYYRTLGHQVKAGVSVSSPTEAQSCFAFLNCTFYISTHFSWIAIIYFMTEIFYNLRQLP